MEFVDRNILGICKDHLNYITMADCKHFRGDAIDLETFSGNIISGIVFTKRRKLLIFKFTECEKTEETLMTSWYPAVTAVFNDKTITKVWSFLIRSIQGLNKFLTLCRIYRNFLSRSSTPPSPASPSPSPSPSKSSRSNQCFKLRRV